MWSASAPPLPNHTRDRWAYGLIIAAGALCFLLLAWEHLGLGALLIPPARTAPQLEASAGPLTTSLSLDSGQLTAAGPNTVSVLITESAGRPVTDATVQARPEMRTMAMGAPPVAATPAGAGRYVAHPRFAMAGDWRIVVTISHAGQASRIVTFDVTVRWN